MQPMRNSIVKVICGWLTLYFAYKLLAVIMRVEIFEYVILTLGRCFFTFVFTVAVLKYIDYFYERSQKSKTVHPQGKAVLITGCDTGFGFETALRLYCMGFQVYAGCLDPKINGGLTLSSVDKNNRLVTLTMDVTNAEQVDNAYQFISSHLEAKNLSLWAIVNNAGVCSWSELEFCSTETYQKVLNTNTLGAVRVTKTFLPLLKQFQGRLIMVSSLAGLLSYPGLTAYCMSKHAIAALADGLRKEFSKWNISVTTIESAGYRTAMVNSQKVKHDMDNNWKMASKCVQEEYGEEYFTAFRNAHIKRLSSLSDNIGQAVDTIVTAVESEYIRDRYYTSLKAEMRAFGRFLPQEWQDIFMLTFESFDSVLCRFKFGFQPEPDARNVLLAKANEMSEFNSLSADSDFTVQKDHEILLEATDALIKSQKCIQESCLWYIP
ncbi:17-beta-hydroxysteroid dehydrogenase type 6-like [Paramacrobiotus metropolitanus]|uniref:17-beta-hydroxysteroid dehydrogenase type 6-like n=1 Tax=Paramacrobiotus metropolitanus TaxID=2943436 RepID=UPI0024461374|nr:17-beta-hydroxysteroid dehydrogenase type 6-like [Paramacrobiotus metropolitanus]